MSFHHPVQTIFFPSKHSFFINKGFPVRCLIKNSPLSTEVLTTLERFSLSNQTRAKNTRKTDSINVCMLCEGVCAVEHDSVLYIFLPRCFYLQRSSPLLEKVQMHSYPWQSTERWKWRMKHHTDVVIFNMILIRDLGLPEWRTPTILFIASSFRDSLLFSSISFRSSFLQRNRWFSVTVTHI